MSMGVFADPILELLSSTIMFMGLSGFDISRSFLFYSSGICGSGKPFSWSGTVYSGESDTSKGSSSIIYECMSIPIMEECWDIPLRKLDGLSEFKEFFEFLEFLERLLPRCSRSPCIYDSYIRKYFENVINLNNKIY